MPPPPPSTRAVVEEVGRAAVKPQLRGWLHAGTFPVALAAGIVLVVLADGAREIVANAVYAASAALLFGVSAIYHRGHWSPRAEVRLKRLDHSNIFLIIAGTYTPFAVILLPEPRRHARCSGSCGPAALGGIAFRVFWVGAPRWLYTPVYLALGWVAVFYLRTILADRRSRCRHAARASAAALYSVGGVVYAIKRPNPSPRWFGFHEVFHALTLAAFVAHYIAISMVTYNAVGA